MGWSWKQRRRCPFEGKKAYRLDQAAGQIQGLPESFDVGHLPVRNPLVAKSTTFLKARHYPMYFIYSLGPHYNTVRSVLLLSTFTAEETEAQKLNGRPTVLQLVHERAGV